MKMPRIPFIIIHIVILVYAGMLISFSLFPFLVHAQPPPKTPSIVEYQIDNLDRRINTIEALALDHRLTMIETVLENLKTGAVWGQVSTGGIGLLLVREVIKAIHSRKEGTKDED